MTPEEWSSCTDPKPMLRYLSRRGLAWCLWRFIVTSCRRVEERLPGKAFREVLRLADDLRRGQATWEMIDGALAEASERLEKLVAKYQDMEEGEEYERLGRKIDAAGVVFVFQYQDGYEAAAFVSDYFLERAEDQQAEQRAQAKQLRELVPDPDTELGAESDEID